MKRQFFIAAGSRRIMSAGILFMALFILKADSVVSSRKKPFHDTEKEVVSDAELKSPDKTKGGHERVARTLMTGRVIDTFTPWQQDGEKRFGPNAEAMKRTEELVPLDKSVDGPMPIYDDDVGAVDPLEGLLPQKYWEERDDGQQVSLINDFFRKNVHNHNTPFSITAGNENGNNNMNSNPLVRREFVSDAENNKNSVNNDKRESEANNVNLDNIKVGANIKQPGKQFHGGENSSPTLTFTEGINRPMNLYNDYASTHDSNRVPLTDSENGASEYEKTSSLQIADPLAGGEHASADISGNAGPTGFVFYSEPRRATDISPLNSNLADGIGKIVDTIMKDVIINNLKSDQQKVSPPPSCSNEGEVVFTSLVENAFPPLSTRGAPLERVFSLKPNSVTNKADLSQPKLQLNYNSGRKLLFVRNNANNNKEKKYPMPLRTKENKLSLTSQSKSAKNSNQNSLLSRNQKMNLQSASNRSRVNELNRIYTNAIQKYPSRNNGIYDNETPSVTEMTESEKEKLARLKNLNEYQNYLNVVKNMNRAEEENKNQNKLPPSSSSSSSTLESVTKKENITDKENILQKINEVNYLLNIQNIENEKKDKNESTGPRTNSQHMEYKIDDYTNKLKQQDNRLSALPDASNQIFDDSNKYKLEPNHDKSSKLALPNVENKYKYPLVQPKNDQTLLPAPEKYDKVIPPNSNGPPLLAIPSPEQNDNVLFQQKIKQVQQNPPAQPENNIDGNAYKLKKPDSDHSEQPTNTENNNTYKSKATANDQPVPPQSVDQTGDKPGTNTSNPALMIEEINKFILQRKAKLESLSAYIANLRLKKLEEKSTQSNAVLPKNRRQINESDLEKGEKDITINNSNNKNDDNDEGFSDEDAADSNRDHFLGEDQNLSEDAGFLAGFNGAAPTVAATMSGVTIKENSSGPQVLNFTTASSGLTFAINTTMQTPTTTTVKEDAKSKLSTDSTASTPHDVSKHPELNDDELEAMNINVSNRIVDRIFQQADQTNNMRANLGLCRKNNSVKSLKASAKVLPETEAVLRQVLECIRGLIKYQLQKQTCNVLDKELYEFLKWMLLTGEAKHGTDYLTRRRKHGSVKTDFLFHNECDTSTPCARFGAAADGNTNKLNPGPPRIFGK